MKQKVNSLCLAVVLSLPVVTATGLVGCSPDTSADRTTGEVVDDKELSSRVQSALRNNTEYKFEEVNVTSYRDTVQLSGFVSTADQKRKAGEIAGQIEGVKNVENNITTKDNVN